MLGKVDIECWLTEKSVGLQHWDFARRGELQWRGTRLVSYKDQLCAYRDDAYWRMQYISSIRSGRIMWVLAVKRKHRTELNPAIEKALQTQEGTAEHAALNIIIVNPGQKKF